jgi:hypothetical protein
MHLISFFLYVIVIKEYLLKFLFFLEVILFIKMEVLLNLILMVIKMHEYIFNDYVPEILIMDYIDALME